MSSERADPGRADPGVVFTEAAKTMQTRLGSREAMARLEERRGFPKLIDAGLAAFLQSRDSVYLATASADGQPYIQHRGGPAGFIHVLDERRFAFAELPGNRQYLTFGNLSENPKAHLFAMDYPNRRRIKIWGTARLAEKTTPDSADAALWDALTDGAERALVFTVEAWDANCPQHITPRFTEKDIAVATQGLRARITEQAIALQSREREIERLQAALAARSTE